MKEYHCPDNYTQNDLTGVDCDTRACNREGTHCMYNDDALEGNPAIIQIKIYIVLLSIIKYVSKTTQNSLVCTKLMLQQ